MAAAFTGTKARRVGSCAVFWLAVGSGGMAFGCEAATEILPPPDAGPLVPITEESSTPSTPCALGQLSCGDVCVDPLTSAAHCGSCGNACPIGSVCESGVCSVSCALGQQLCGGICTTVISDPANCGACGTACPAGQFCDNGACSATCSGVLCNGPTGAVCVNVTSNPSHCGACSLACAAGQSCVDARCTLVCPSDRLACGGSCVVVASDPANCGACGVACPAGTPCINGACGCPTGLVLCGGACVDILNSPAHCGACGASCGTGLCISGQCQCSAGEANCNNVCANLTTDPSNCGACGNVCPPGTLCSAGVCSSGCAAGTVACGTSCVDTATDRLNCGSCGNVCAAGQVCTASTCTCPAAGTFCGGQCVDVLTNGLHCGQCDVACSGGQTCTGGQCVCPAGQESCNGACMVFTDNPLNCGACGVACVSTQTCVGTQCQCPSGQQLCSEQCVDTLTSNENCGACGQPCVGGQTCSAGQCQCAAGLQLCGELCVDTQSSNVHCGACDQACAEGSACEAGQCTGEVGDGEDGCSGQAHSITLTKLAMYQAVEVPLMEDGTAIATSSRGADIAQGHPAVLRAFVELASGWQSREVSVRLHLTAAAQEETLFIKKTFTTNSSQSSLETTAQVEVPAESVQADTRYWVEIVECTGVTGTIAAPRFPGTGDQALEARATGPLKMAFVPVQVGSLLPDTSSTALAVYTDYLFAMYPATSIETSVTSTITTSSPVNWSTLLDQIRSKRASDAPADDIYYFGLLKPAATLREYCQNGCTAGISYVVDTSRSAADFRAGCGLAYADETSASTMAHELGHAHGREHAPCGVSPFDGNYPYSGGLIGSWGYDARSATLQDPSDVTDIMSYCNPQWASDYTFQGFLERIALLNGATSASVLAPSAAAQTWRVLLVEGENRRWGNPIEKPMVPAGAAMPARVVDSLGNPVSDITVYRVPVSLPGHATVLVPEPQPGWFAVEVDGGPALTF